MRWPVVFCTGGGVLRWHFPWAVVVLCGGLFRWFFFKTTAKNSSAMGTGQRQRGHRIRWDLPIQAAAAIDSVHCRKPHPADTPCQNEARKKHPTCGCVGTDMAAAELALILRLLRVQSGLGSVRVSSPGTLPCELHSPTHAALFRAPCTRTWCPALSNAPCTLRYNLHSPMHLALFHAPCTRTWHPTLSHAPCTLSCRIHSPMQPALSHAPCDRTWHPEQLFLLEASCGSHARMRV